MHHTPGTSGNPIRPRYDTRIMYHFFQNFFMIFGVGLSMIAILLIIFGAVELIADLFGRAPAEETGKRPPA